MTDLEPWLLDAAAELGLTGVDPTTPLMEAGLSSRDAVALTGMIGERLGVDVPPTILWEHPSLGELAAHLQALTAQPLTAQPLTEQPLTAQPLPRQAHPLEALLSEAERRP